MFFLTESGANVVRNFHIRKRKGEYLQIKKEKELLPKDIVVLYSSRQYK